MSKYGKLVWICSLAAACTMLAACRDKASTPAGGSSPTPRPTSTAAVDWSKVKSAGGMNVAGPALFPIEGQDLHDLAEGLVLRPVEGGWGWTRSLGG